MTISFNSKYKYLKIYLSIPNVIFYFLEFIHIPLYTAPTIFFPLQVSTYVLIIVKFESQLII